jgi:ubiquinone/menaquinone biosynthesis C-methylase UbiE
VRLYTADVNSMPFLDWHFDCIVAISTIEFIDGLDAACNEIDRVLKQDGCFLVVTPTNSPIRPEVANWQQRSQSCVRQSRS